MALVTLGMLYARLVMSMTPAAHTINQKQRLGDRVAMSEQSTTGEERVPFMQRVLDNPFILLFIGIVFPAVFYIIWGIMEIVNIPIAP